RQMLGMTRLRRRLALGLRLALVTILVLALAGLQSARTNKGVSTVFVLDQSDSIRPDFTAAAHDFIARSLNAMGTDDHAGLVVFGTDPVIDVNTGSLRDLAKIYSRPDPSATDIAAAIRLATAAMGEGTAKRLVLLTDGNETQGDAAEAASVAATEGVQIDYVRPPEPSVNTPQVVLQDLVAPTEVTKGQPFQVRVEAQATAPAEGVIHLDRDGVPVGNIDVELAKGANSFVLSQTVENPGFYRYRATLDVPADPEVRNKVGMGYVSVKGRPKILVLEGKPGIGQSLAQALGMHDLDVVRGGPEKLPTRPEDLQSYDSIVLDDFPADFLTDKQMQLVASSVRDSGVGLAMVGGEGSFLPGGYYDTPIADALPVDLNIRQRKDFPSSTIVIVLDTSGSMGMIEDGEEKVKIAASAAAATVRMVNANDYIGVAGSTDDIAFVAPIQHPINKDAISAQIGTMDVGGGGIYIEPSLEFAEKALAKWNTQVRHLILMADGNDCDSQEGSFALAQKMVNEKMTISVVAIGDGKDVGFLKKLAAIGHGAYYLALRAHQLQRLFTRDASTMNRSAIEVGAFLPKVDPGDEALAGLDLRTMPALYAYDLSSSRPLARTPMLTAKDDPLLAFWQYGLGTSMAFTSDAQPKWARRWMGWPGFNAFWAQTLRSTLRHTSANKVTINAKESGGKGLVDLQAFDPAGNPINNLGAKVNVLAPDGRAQQVTVSQTGPGQYEGNFDASQVGGYIITAAESGSAGEKGSSAPHDAGFPLSTPRERGAGGEGLTGAPSVAVTRAGFAIAYPPEYQAVRPDVNLLARVAQATGGEALPNPVLAFRPSGNPGVSIKDLYPLLIFLAGLLLPLDIAIRRVALPFAEIWAAVLAGVGRLAGLRRAPRPESAQAPALARLQAAKKSVGQDPHPRPLSRAGERGAEGPTDPGSTTPASAGQAGVGQDNGLPSPLGARRAGGEDQADGQSTAERLLALKRQRKDKE
ncbi:MAG TPA: VWA domain-containing protein, partial [Capsulimonadaceae bacterium]|nr:VWA domain-containing protein [Capsulimonadaceae bacterium]